jgi:hypothetical protein
MTEKTQTDPLEPKSKLMGEIRINWVWVRLTPEYMGASLSSIKLTLETTPVYILNYLIALKYI